MQQKWFFSALLLGAGAGAGLALREHRKRKNARDLHGRVVLITGGSRGLGLAMAEEFARCGARLILCARQPEPLERAKQRLTQMGAEVLALSCDVRNQQEVEELIEQAHSQFGQIDVLVNNAGIITTGPQQVMTLQDYVDAMDTMFWGMVYSTLAVLPSMRARQSGHIVNITSIGGKVSVPHLLPYSSAKFAALGFSEGLHAELAREGIHVTTVVPGLMRTGSHINAFVKGEYQKEYALFGLAATLPFTSTSASSAARRIVQATRQGKTELIITPQAQLLGRFHGLLPGLTTNILSLVDRTLPGASTTSGREPKRGRDVRSHAESRLTVLGEPAAQTYNQYTQQE